METMALGIGFGLVTGAILALAALAFTLQYAVSNILNLAFGELLTYGAYAGYVATGWTHNLVIAGFAAALAGGATAWAINAGMIEPFARARVKTVVIFIGTLGVSLVLQNAVLFIFGGTSLAYALPADEARRVGPFLWTLRDERIMMAAFAVAALLYLMLYRTKFGTSLRAVSANRNLAAVSGIDVRRVVRYTWWLAGAAAGFAGFVLAVTLGTLTPTVGARYLLVTMTAAVAGGLGKPHGAIAAAILLGLTTEVTALYVDAAYKLLVAFGVLVLVVLLRSDRLFARWSGDSLA
jgi:branched-subunit amino acid ABC-type transport system permease component